MSENLVSIRVWGDFACFTRPEMKVERVSYPLMTPSAARGVLEAIFWEPQMFYLIDAVRVVKKGRWVSFRRNEVSKRVSLHNARPIQAGGGAADGTQRNMLALEDVAYVITAEIKLSELGRSKGHSVTAYRSEVERRARQGKCFYRPALGVREFAADFDWLDAPNEVALADWPEQDLGVMLYDVFDHSGRAQGFRWLSEEEIEQAHAALSAQPGALPKTRRTPVSRQSVQRYEGIAVKPRAAFFRARVETARMDCHPERVQIIPDSTLEE